MAYKLKCIKNPPTANELIQLYESELFNELIAEFSKTANVKMTPGSDDKQMIRQATKRHFLILNIPMEDVISELKTHRSDFLKFCITRHNFYNQQADNNDMGEFAEGDIQDNDNETIEIYGISKLIVLDNFCEFYLTKLGDKERLVHFLQTTRMPAAKKHASQISKIYKSISA